MTYKEVVEKVRNEFGKSDVSNYEDHLALQVNIIGEGSGAFYVEINEGELSIEEFDYVNNNAEISASADDIISVFSGALDINSALDNGKIRITGDYAKALSIQPVIDNGKKSSKKTTAKKATEKKAAPKKTVSKKTAVKSEEKKTAEGKAVASKSTAKTASKSSAKTPAKKSTAKKSGK